MSALTRLGQIGLFRRAYSVFNPKGVFSVPAGVPAPAERTAIVNADTRTAIVNVDSRTVTVRAGD